MRRTPSSGLELAALASLAIPGGWMAWISISWLLRGMDPSETIGNALFHFALLAPLVVVFSGVARVLLGGSATAVILVLAIGWLGILAIDLLDTTRPFFGKLGSAGIAASAGAALVMMALRRRPRHVQTKG